MRSRSEMKPDRTLRNVVLPAPVPPEMRTFSRAATDACRKSSIGCVSDLRSTRSFAPRRSVRNRRIDSTGPSSASGGMMALTREPSCEPRVDHRARLVDAAAHRADDALDDAQQVRIVLEDELGRFELAFALDVDLIRLVDQDVRDARIGEQRLERPEAEELVEDVGDERFALEQAERNGLRLGVEQPDDQPADLGLGLRPADAVQAIEIEAVQQRAVDAALSAPGNGAVERPLRPRERRSVSSWLPSWLLPGGSQRFRSIVRTDLSSAAPAVCAGRSATSRANSSKLNARLLWFCMISGSPRLSAASDVR